MQPATARRPAIAAIVTSVVVVSSGATLVNIAVPGIADDFGISATQVVWVVGAYQVAIVACLLPFAALGEKLGYRRVFRAGLLVYLLAAALAMQATGFGALVAARALQGFGAAATLSVLGAVVRSVYPPGQLGRGISINAFVVATTYSVAPVVGSVILTFGQWPLLFAVQVPVCLVALLATRALPQTAPQPRRFDRAGAALNAVTFALLVVALGQMARRPALALALLGVGAGLLLLLLRQQRGQAAPLLPVDLLGMPRLGFAALVSFLGFAGYVALLVTLPLYLSRSLGKSPLQIGTLLAVLPLATSVAALAAGRLADRLRPEALGLFGTTTLGLAVLSLPWLPDGALWAGLALAGVGFAFFQTPNNRILVGSAPPLRAGGASGLQAMARELGFATGLALLGVSFGLFAAAGPGVGLLLSGVLLGLASLAGLTRLLQG